MIARKAVRRQKIRYRIRKKVKGTSENPRLCVFRSNKEIYAQIIDDVAGHTLVSASSRTIKDFKGNKSEMSKQVGTVIAKLAAEKNIKLISFDRGGYLYHGRIKALAEGAREGGLQF
ncbi:MAG: 50S ribosomal protein L18 [Chitinophagales bacterium]|nr:50S ribosomal protein L18 [Chitinophagales bacterium]